MSDQELTELIKPHAEMYADEVFEHYTTTADLLSGSKNGYAFGVVVTGEGSAVVLTFSWSRRAFNMKKPDKVGARKFCGAVESICKSKGAYFTAVGI